MSARSMLQTAAPCAPEWRLHLPSLLTPTARSGAGRAFLETSRGAALFRFLALTCKGGFPQGLREHCQGKFMCLHQPGHTAEGATAPAFIYWQLYHGEGLYKLELACK